MKTIKRIVITPGEPAGIGPDILLAAIQKPHSAQLIAIADPDLLRQRARWLNLPLHLHDWNNQADAALLPPGHLTLLPTKQLTHTEPGILNPGNAEYVLQTLEIASKLCINKQVDALVTGPVHKGTMNRAGIVFFGHTEFFARIANAVHTVMLFVTPEVKVALATTHVPLKQVSEALTKEGLYLTLTTLDHDLQRLFKITKPKIFVAGLNPHAGESGFLGREEIDIITPVICELQQKHYTITGPFPADTIFTPAYLQQADVILAMYHDQALPLVKYLGFGQAVNVTLGLPFVRTSVDHGTALDIAGTGKADPGSLLKAIELAIELST